MTETHSITDFKKAYKWWHGKDPEPEVLNEIYERYYQTLDVPFWMNHWLRNAPAPKEFIGGQP